MESDRFNKSYAKTMVVLAIVAIILAIIALAFYIWRSVRPIYPVPLPVAITSAVPITPTGPSFAPIGPFHPPHGTVPVASNRGMGSMEQYSYDQ